MFEVELPYPPSINHYWRRVGQRTLISREGRRFRQRVVAILAARGVEPMTGPLAVEVEIFPPDRHRRDIDYVQKALLDALQHGGAYELGDIPVPVEDLPLSPDAFDFPFGYNAVAAEEEIPW